MRFTLSTTAIAMIALACGCSSSSTSTGGTDAGTGGGTDGGGSGNGSIADGFVGTWTRAGSVTVMCGSQTPTMQSLTGNLVIALGSSANTIVGTTPEGCKTTYTLSGSTASESPGQSCMTTDGTITSSSHTLTLSGDKKTLSETSQAIIAEADPDGGKMNCDFESMGTFTKQ